MARESFFSISDIIRDRRKLTVFLVCVAVSVLSWLMLSLGESYSSTLVVPVKYVNFPENKVLLNNVPDNLAVSVSGTGFDLLQYDERLIIDTLTVNLDNLKMSVFGDYERGYLDPAILSQSLQKRINGAIAINRVLSDSIEFLFDLKVSRLIRVQPNVEYSIQKGYALIDSVSAQPEFVEIYGPLSILDTLKSIQTNKIQAGELNAVTAYRTTLNLSRLGNDAYVQPDSVQVKLVVDRLTEKRFMVEPVQLNVPDTLDVITFPAAIEVIAQVPLSKFDDVQHQQFELTIDYKEHKEGYPVLPLRLESWPVVAKNIIIRPKQVELVISRNN